MEIPITQYVCGQYAFRVADYDLGTCTQVSVSYGGCFERGCQLESVEARLDSRFPDSESLVPQAIPGRSIEISQEVNQQLQKTNSW